MNSYIFRSSMIGTLSIAFNILGALLLIPLIIHNAGLEKFGMWAMLAIFSNLAPMLDLGITRAMIYYGGPHETHSNRSRSIIWTSVALVAAILGATAVVWMAFSLLALGLVETASSAWTPLLILGPVVVASTVATGLVRGFFEMQLKVHLTHALNILFQLLNLPLVLLMAYQTADVVLMMSATTAATFVVTGVHILLAWKIGFPRFSSPNPLIARTIVRRAYWFFLLSVANSAAIPINRILVSYFGGPTAHALFDIGIRVATAATSLLQTISVPLFGIFLKERTRAPERVRSLAKQVTVTVGGLYALGIVSLFFFAGPISTLFSSAQTDTLSLVILVLVAGIAFSAVSEPSTRLLWTWGRTREVVAIKLTALVANIVFCSMALKLPVLISVSLSLALATFLAGIATIAFTIHAAADSRHPSPQTD